MKRILSTEMGIIYYNLYEKTKERKEKMKKEKYIEVKTKNLNEGITLIALVITIVLNASAWS